MLHAVWVLGAAGQCLGSWAILPAHSPAPHLQGDSSFVVMTNFIITPHQAQGYCAEVRTAAHPSFFNPKGKMTWQRRSPWAPEVKLDRLPLGPQGWNFRHGFAQSNRPPSTVLRLPFQLYAKQDAEPLWPPNLQVPTFPHTAS